MATATTTSTAQRKERKDRAVKEYTYVWEGLDRNNRQVRGEVKAASETVVTTSLRRQGIRLVAERVDEDGMVPLLCDLGVPLAQGFAFAAPRPVKTEILDEQAALQPVDMTEAPARLRRVG